MIPLISEEQLVEWSGYKRRASLLNWLNHHKIPYLLGQGGRVCVTADAINLPLLHIRHETATSNNDIEF
ncbi:MAG: DUF4224 domain-containing protein [Methylovulum sp.]|nr:DUF4224 domain-containing protein [Methylovulum sp.]